MNELLKILISEPWNFASSDGENILKCILVRKTQIDSLDVMICRCISDFNIGVEKIEYIGLTNRGKIKDEFNIYKIKGINSMNVENSVLLKENFVHIMIGTNQL